MIERWYDEPVEGTMAGWYLMYQDQYDTIIGLLGPYPQRRHAEAAIEIHQEAEKMLLRDVDTSSDFLIMPRFYTTVTVISLSPEEIGQVTIGEK